MHKNEQRLTGSVQILIHVEVECLRLDLRSQGEEEEVWDLCLRTRFHQRIFSMLSLVSDLCLTIMPSLH